MAFALWRRKTPRARPQAFSSFDDGAMTAALIYGSPFAALASVLISAARLELCDRLGKRCGG